MRLTIQPNVLRVILTRSPENLKEFQFFQPWLVTWKISIDIVNIEELEKQELIMLGQEQSGKEYQPECLHLCENIIKEKFQLEEDCESNKNGEDQQQSS